MKRADDVVTRDNRIVGCRGRVLVAIIILAILVLMLVALLLYSLFAGPQQPVRRASIDSENPIALARSDMPIAG